MAFDSNFKIGERLKSKLYPSMLLEVNAFDRYGDKRQPVRCTVLMPGESSWSKGSRDYWPTVDSIIRCGEYVKQPAKERPDEIVVIKRFGDRTEAYCSVTGGPQRKKASVKRFRDDAPSMHRACIYVLDKLFDGSGVDVTISSTADGYTGFVAVTGIGPSGQVLGYGFTPGMVVHFENGRCITPNGGASAKCKSFGDVCNNFPGVNFIELHT